MYGVLALFGAIAALAMSPALPPGPEPVAACAGQCAPRAVSGGELYYVDRVDGPDGHSSWSLWAVGTEGGEPRLVTRTDRRAIGDVRFHDKSVIFSLTGSSFPPQADGAVARVSKKGGTPEVLADGLYTSGMQTDGKAIYLHTGVPLEVKALHRIVRLDPSSGTQSTVGQVPYSLEMTLAGDFVVLTGTDQAPYRLPKAGGAPVALAPGLRCDAIAGRGRRLYCAGDRGGDSGLFEVALDGSGAKLVRPLPGFRLSTVAGAGISFSGDTIVLVDTIGGVHLVPPTGAVSGYVAPRPELIAPQLYAGGWIYVSGGDGILRVRLAPR
jgi:hypothetical protein